MAIVFGPRKLAGLATGFMGMVVLLFCSLLVLSDSLLVFAWLDIELLSCCAVAFAVGIVLVIFCNLFCKFKPVCEESIISNQDIYQMSNQLANLSTGDSFGDIATLLDPNRPLIKLEELKTEEQQAAYFRLVFKAHPELERSMNAYFRSIVQARPEFERSVNKVRAQIQLEESKKHMEPKTSS